MRRWTAEEFEFAVSHCTVWSRAAIARHIGRTAIAVRQKLWQHHQAPSKQDLLTSGQLAARMGISQQWLTRLARRGKLKARRIPRGRWWLFPHPGE